MLLGNWLADRAVEGLLKISFFLDTVIYRIAGWAYKVFYVMGGVIIEADGTAQIVLNKIYTILLIFMVFVVAYNMLLYIINPDKINDGSIGAGNLVKKIAISLVVIVASPLFFDVLYDVQREVIDYNVIGNIILGDSYEDSEVNSRCVASEVENSGDVVVADIYTSFLYPVNGLEASNCCDDTFPTDDDLRSTPSMAKYCAGYIGARETGGVSGFSEVVLSAVNQDDDFQYLGIVSTAAGIIMAVYFLSFCVNLGIRLFKLLALEIIAPIPALLELLPGKSGTLENWFKTVMKVYAQVFIYQAIVFSLVWLATLIPGLLNQVFQSIDVENSGTFSGFLLLARVLLIVALFQACKEVPKMLSEVLGIKGEGGLLNASGLKTIGAFGKKAASIGKGIGIGAFGVGAATVGAVTSGIKNYNSTDSEKGSKGLSAIAGAASSLRRNVWGMRNAKSFKDISATAKKTSQDVQAKRIKRSSYKEAHGGTFMGSVKGHVQDALGTAKETAAGSLGLKTDFSELEAREKAAKKIKDIYAENYGDKLKADSQYARADSDVKMYQNRIDAKFKELMDTEVNTRHYDMSTEAGRKAYDDDVQAAKDLAEGMVDKATGLTYKELLSDSKAQKELAANEFAEKHGKELMTTAEALKAAGYSDSEVMKQLGKELYELDSRDAIGLDGKGSLSVAKMLSDIEGDAKKVPEKISQENRDYTIYQVQKESKKKAKEEAEKAAKEATEDKKGK